MMKKEKRTYLATNRYLIYNGTMKKEKRLICTRCAVFFRKFANYSVLKNVDS